MDREKVVQELEAMRNYHRSIGNNISADIVEDAIELLKEQPQIVRCKDCKYWIGGGIDEKDNFIPPKCGLNNGLHPSADWFCADSERKEEGRNGNERQKFFMGIRR